MFKVFAATHTGLVRKHNEDSYIVFIPSDTETMVNKGALFAVADGVGGRAKGEIASKLALKTLKETYYFSENTSPIPELLKMSFLKAHEHIMSTSYKFPECRGMATTCTALIITTKEAYLAHIGDSRCYLFRNGELTCLTEDHTLISMLLKSGKIKSEEAKKHPKRHMLVQALGATNNIKPQIIKFFYKTGDIFLLCSDGLYDVVSEEIIKDFLKNKSIEAGDDLIEMANKAGGPDNITVLLIKIEEKIMESISKTVSYENLL